MERSEMRNRVRRLADELTEGNLQLSERNGMTRHFVVTGDERIYNYEFVQIKVEADLDEVKINLVCI